MSWFYLLHFFQFTRLKNQPFSAAQFQADYKGDQYSMSLTVANLDIVNESGNFPLIIFFT